MTRAKRDKAAKPRRPLGRRLGESLRAAGEAGRSAVTQPGGVPAKAHGWFRNWFRNIWNVRGGGLYACGFAVTFLFLEIREILFEDIAEFVAINNYLSGQLVEYVIRFFVDTFVNFVQALIWPVHVMRLWPPVGIIALSVAFFVFPYVLKQPIERWLFQDDDKNAG